VRRLGSHAAHAMIIVMSESDGSPMVLEISRQSLLELAAGRRAQPQRARDEFFSLWAQLRHASAHLRHFPNVATAVHFYRFGSHRRASHEIARILDELRSPANTGASLAALTALLARVTGAWQHEPQSPPARRSRPGDGSQ